MYDHVEGLRFTCTGCGDCCRGTNVPLVGDELARLEALDWTGKVARLVGGARAVRLKRPRPGLTHRLARGDDGACAYLAEDSACLIHRHFGGEHKPLACRLYPFQLRPIAGGLTVDAAFSCKSIAERSGEPLRAHQAEWEALAAECGELREPAHRLTKTQRLDGALLRELERALVAFLHDGSLDFFQRVRCCLDFAKLSSTGHPNTEGARLLRAALLAALPTQVRARTVEASLDKTQRAVFFQWLFLCTNPSVPNADLRTPNRLKALERERVFAGQAYRDQDAQAWVAGRRLSATHREIQAVDASSCRSDPEGLLRDFFSAKLTGGRYLIDGEGELGFAEAVVKLMLWYPMATWTAKAFAADRGARQVAPEDLRRALRLLDPPLGQLGTSSLPAPQRKVCDWVFLETDLVVDASAELLDG